MIKAKVNPEFLSEKNRWFQLIKKHLTYHNITYHQDLIREFFTSKTPSTNKKLFLLLIIITQQNAMADRLAQAAISANSHLLTIAQATSGIAFALGAIFYHFGAPQLGKQILIGGVIGLAATFGGPAMIELLRSVFNA